MGDPLHRIPITVLTGFLGSGKTTLINALLRNPNLRDTAVVVNEFGDIALDHLLVTSSSDNVVVLDSGCLCCVVLDSLKETLADLYHRRARAEVPPFSRVIVETTGLADPAPLMQVLLRDSFVSHYFELSALVTTVDAVFGVRQLETQREPVKQVALADRIVITKADVASAEALKQVERAIAALNPHASVHLSPHPSFDVERVLLDPAARTQAFLREPDTTLEPASSDRHDDSVRSTSFVTDRALHWAGLAGWTDLVRKEFGAKLLRCKGLVRIHGLDVPVLVQGVQTVFAAPTRLPAWPSDDRRTRIVCITQGMPKEWVEASFAALFAEPGTYPPASIHELLSRNVP
ncbi:MAG: GTP-binding protein [Gammaproteobacteria bacterium]